MKLYWCISLTHLVCKDQFQLGRTWRTSRGWIEWHEIGGPGCSQHRSAGWKHCLKKSNSDVFWSWNKVIMMEKPCVDISTRQDHLLVPYRLACCTHPLQTVGNFSYGKYGALISFKENVGPSDEAGLPDGITLDSLPRQLCQHIIGIDESSQWSYEH